MNVLWEVCSGLPPVLSKSLNTPVMKVLKHLILQHNESWHNECYAHRCVALHGTADVIINTMQRDRCETDIRDMDKFSKFYRSFSNFCLLLNTSLDNVINDLERANEGITDVRSRDIFINK